MLLAILITAITWKLGTRAVITWRHESEALAKEMVPTADIEQPLLSNGDRHEQGEVHQNRERGSEPEPGRAIAPVRIPTARQSLDAHHVHAHSPMAYSAVGSLTHARNARARYGLKQTLTIVRLHARQTSLPRPVHHLCLLPAQKRAKPGWVGTTTSHVWQD